MKKKLKKKMKLSTKAVQYFSLDLTEREDIRYGGELLGPCTVPCSPWNS